MGEMHCSYLPSVEKSSNLKSNDGIKTCRTASVLTSERFPIDAILEHNNRVVESARKTIRETHEIIFRAMVNKENKSTLGDATFPLNTCGREAPFIPCVESADINRTGQASLPHISQFFKPLDIHENQKKTAKFFASSYSESVFKNELQLKQPPLLYRNERLTSRFGSNESIFPENTLDLVYSQPPNGQLDDKKPKEFLRGSSGSISPNSVHVLESPTKSTSSKSDSTVDTFIENTDKSIERLSNFPYRYNTPDDSDLSNRHMNSVLTNICGQFKGQFENIIGPRRTIETKHQIGLEQSLVKEIKGFLGNRKTSVIESPSFPDYLPKEQHVGVKENFSRESYWSNNIYHTPKQHYVSKKYPSPSYKENQVTNRMTIKSQTTMKEKKRGYLCNECGKVYCRKYVLKIHQRVHSGEKPLVCQVCGKCFSDPSNMKKHVKLHDHDPASFACKYCQRQFMTKKGLVNHLHCVHSREFVNSNCYF